MLVSVWWLYTTRYLTTHTKYPLEGYRKCRLCKYDVKVADGSYISGTVETISTAKELKALTGKRSKQAVDALVRADVVRAQNTDRTEWDKNNPLAVGIAKIRKAKGNKAADAALAAINALG